ncbi:MAG: hypothetical protein IKY48_05175 [Bacteroidales bacterium]|nr:hypothetical protein [Bacteroidales bacterium]
MKKIIFALMLAFAATACYDDSALVEDVNGLKDQVAGLDAKVTELAEKVATLQLNVDALTTIAQELKNGKYITECTPVEDGYTIKFNDGTTIVIKHGAKGEQGEKGDTGENGATGATGEAGVTPTITVQEVDGVLYWFINGEKAAPVYEGSPKFTSVDGNLYVTYPGSTEPEFIGALTGVSIFDEVIVDEEAGTVTFVFVGENGQAGDSFVLPLAEKFALEIAASVGLKQGQTEVEIPYTVKGANETTVVDAIAVGCVAVVENGVVKVSGITAGAQIIVFADNGEGKTSIKKIVFASESYSVEEVDEVIPAEGGQVVVKGISNVEFEVVIPAEATWLTLAPATKSAFELTFVAAANEAEEARQAVVNFVRKGTEEVLMSVTIAQAGNVVVKEFAERVWDIAVPFGGGQDRNMTMDGEYVYVAQAAGGNGVIKAISIADPTATKDVKVATYTPAGLTNGTHAISCVRMLPNTDASVNNGKPVLVASNLTTGDGTAKLIVYVWSNGIDAAPNYFVIDSGTRRLGDKFTVKGSYQSGELHFFDYGDGNVVIRVNMKDGVAGLWGTPELAYATGRYNMPVNAKSNIAECTIHPNATFDGDGNPTAALLATNTVNGFFTQTSGNGYELSAWGTDPDLTQTWGYNFFTHNEKAYIAYVKLASDRSSATLNVIEDVYGAADFKGTLEAKTGLYTAPINGTGNAGHGVADCAVAQVDGTTYVAVMAQNIGISLFKLN